VAGRWLKWLLNPVMNLSVQPLQRVRLSAARHGSEIEDRMMRDLQAYLRGLLSRRLAPFRNAGPNMAPCAADAGLAVFDAIPASPRGPVFLPSWRGHPACRAATPGSAGERSAPRPANSDEPAPQARWLGCPKCGWTDVRRSAAHHLSDYLLSVVGLVPYRCRTCSDRFHRARQTTPSPGPRSTDVSSMPSRTLCS